ncbi:TetR/AcrR family transcriptional regulator [Myxococcus sp. K38C18041901]|uniref:TetR/AcrR family transcriptional regulator n=1 Tax=Myxococcus guangdongensis TaxID=2906760 RepID=UPI0020A6F466|nr:TetR/AcrR family transcriptional regulator [Myxococcus guangdongensis]MCP3065551.1 TetR/AcrR family transcriptional regulator [Myxococcus guangdongensis]
MSSDPRTAILNAAGEVFGRYGFKKASVEDIAKRAGVGKGSIYLHFENKEALFEACAQQEVAASLSELRARLRDAKTPVEQLRVYIRCRMEQNTRSPTGQRIEMATLLELGEAAAHMIPKMMDDETSVLAALIENGVIQGAFHLNNSREVARGMVELITCLGPWMMTSEPDEQSQKALDASFEVFIRGLTVPPLPTS